MKPIKIEDKHYIKGTFKCENGITSVVNEKGVSIANELSLSYAFMKKKIKNGTVILIECDEHGNIKRREHNGSIICKQFTDEEKYKQALIKIKNLLNKKDYNNIRLLINECNI